jgi:hypothetical protein
MALLTERSTRCACRENGDNPSLLMYKGEAKQIPSPLIAYARFTRI